MNKRYTIQIVLVEVTDLGEVKGKGIETFGPTKASDDLDALRTLAIALDSFCDKHFDEVVGQEHTSDMWGDKLHDKPVNTRQRKVN